MGVVVEGPILPETVEVLATVPIDKIMGSSNGVPAVS